MWKRAPVQAGKHAFTEKPNGIDADGVHVTIEAAKIAEEKKRANVSGLCYRHDLLRIQAIERIRNGEIGEIMAAQSDYLPWHSKQGQRALRWDWLQEEELTIRHGIGDLSRVGGLGKRNRACFAVWAYAEEPTSDALVFQFCEGAKVTGAFRWISRAGGRRVSPIRARETGRGISSPRGSTTARLPAREPTNMRWSFGRPRR